MQPLCHKANVCSRSKIGSYTIPEQLAIKLSHKNQLSSSHQLYRSSSLGPDPRKVDARPFMLDRCTVRVSHEKCSVGVTALFSKIAALELLSVMKRNRCSAKLSVCSAYLSHYRSEEARQRIVPAFPHAHFLLST